MATYYVSFTHGLDTNNGLGPDASHSTNKPWKTLGKVLATGSTVVPGDTVYFAPDIWFGAATTPISGVSSSGSPLSLRGDPQNAQGFKNSSGVLVAQGPVMFTTRTSAEGIDGTIASTGVLITANTNGTNGLKWYDVIFECRPDSGGPCVQLSGSANADWLFESCRFIGQSGIEHLSTSTPTAGRNLTCRGCVFYNAQAWRYNSSVAAATADANLAILFEGCYIFARMTGATSLGTSAGNKSGGVAWKGCTVIGNGGSAVAITTTASVCSTVTPMTVEGCLILMGTFVTAGTSGHVIDNGYNRTYNWGASSNFSLAGTSVQRFAPMLVWPDIAAWGLEMPHLPWFSWGPGAVDTQRYTAWTNTSQDFRLRTARPWGSGASPGAVETGKWVMDTGSAITGGGANSMKITGAGEVSFWVPVDASSTTISVTTKSTSYGGSNYPQIVVEASAAVGVTQQTDTAAAATEETLSVTFTPTANGVVEVRLVSRSTSTSSVTYFDLLTAT